MTDFWPRHHVFKGKAVRMASAKGITIIYYDKGETKRFVHPKHRAADRERTEWIIEDVTKMGEVVMLAGDFDDPELLAAGSPGFLGQDAA